MPNIDRRDDEMPTQSLLMRYQSPYPRRSAYAKPDNLKPIPEGDKGKGLRAMAASGDAGKKKVEDFGFSPITRKNKFCGGKSKPYKK